MELMILQGDVFFKLGFHTLLDSFILTFITIDLHYTCVCLAIFTIYGCKCKNGDGLVLLDKGVMRFVFGGSSLSNSN
jgi:hypothetical protein